MKSIKIKGSRWEIWHQDYFDPNTPRKVILAGDELIDGLTELWIRHLYDTLRQDGFVGFSKYNLWLVQSRQSIEVIGDLAGQKKLREWIFRGNLINNKSSLDAVGLNLLYIIAKTHCRLFQEGQTSEIIVEKAKDSDDSDQFIGMIENL